MVTNFDDDPVAVTDDGDETNMFNGVADWMHSGEVEADNTHFWWSANGTFLAFEKLDETEVGKFEFSFYGKSKYPTMVKYPYAKPGTAIPKISLWIANAHNLSAGPREITPSTTVTDWAEYYLSSVAWKGDEVLTPTWRNRYGNRSVTELCVPPNWVCSHVSEMVLQSDSGWIGTYKPAHVVHIGTANEYATVRSNSEGFPHIVIVDTLANTVDWRTSGTFEVTDISSGEHSIYYYDERNDWLYFTSTEVESIPSTGLPRIRHMWRVKGHRDDRTRTCITCYLNVDYKDRCNWVEPSFSPGGRYVVVNCGGTANGAPISTLHKIDADGAISFVRVVESNQELVDNMEAFYIRTREYEELKLPYDDEIYYYAIHKPPDFDPSKKYPLLLQVYSGWLLFLSPGYQYGTDTHDWYNVDWGRWYLPSSDLGVITITFDLRGTGYRGDKIRQKVYRQLGKLEPLDQIQATKQIIAKYSFIDSDRIAVWGRSYGGYMTARIMEEDTEYLFKCGFSVAPVADWMTYSTIYTEKYMGSPYGDNEVGYNESTALQKIENIANHYFVIIHGTSDENVHFLNAALLAKSLVDKDIDFEAYFAADETHKFDRGKKATGHHYKLTTRHLKTCLGL